jgi:hypothetical protein
MTHYLGYEKGQAPKLEANQERENQSQREEKKTLVSENGISGATVFMLTAIGLSLGGSLKPTRLL